MKIKDIVILGCLAGICGTYPVRLINAIESKLGLTKLDYDKRAVSLFVKGSKVNKLSKTQKLLGLIINNTMTGLAGTSLAYLISKTGKKGAALKGVGLALVYWLFTTGFAAKMGITTLSDREHDDLLSAIDHIIGGAIGGTVAAQLIDESLLARREPLKLKYKGTF